MDPVSLGIVVTVLSFGTILLFLFNVDFAKRRGTKVATASAVSQQQAENTSLPNNNNNKSKPNKNNNKTSPHSQQAIRPQNGPSNQSNPKKSPLIAKIAPNGDSNRSIAVKSEERTKLKHDIPDLIASHEPKGFVHSQQAPAKHQQQSSTTNGCRPVKRKESKTAKPAVVVSPELEPFLDELDSSIAMEMYNPLFSAKHNRAATNKKRQSASLGADSFEGILNYREMGSTMPSYSSEQLFTMIAASNLSRDEVESAVEMLLNKIDSGESDDWKKPKSDPVERLKNQLRDSESVLSIEIQNHEQTRARLIELKSQIQGERQSSTKLEDELSKARKELSVANLALEQARADVSRVQTATKQREEENARMVSRLEQEKLQLQTIIANESNRGVDYETMRVKYDEKLVQLQCYELNQQKINERVAELENKLRVADRLVDELRASKQHDDYEASAKISELKSDRIQLDKALKDHIVRFKEISEANHLLGNTIQELRLINNRQDEMLKQMTDERQIHEASMKRTLQEMELELKELQQKLNANTILSQQDDRARKVRDVDASQVHRVDGEREQKLLSEMNELRDGLAALFPDAVKAPSSSTDGSSNGAEHRSNSWVQEYVIALKQLSKTLDELKEPNNNVRSSTNSESPKKLTSDKSTLTPTRKKTPSPTHNGRSSRASTYHGGHNGDKKVHETKLLEPEDDSPGASSNKMQEEAVAGECSLIVG